MIQKAQQIMKEVQKVVIGKEESIAKVLMAMLAKGHVLIEDIPGVGKTTLALAFSKAFSLEYKRIQFTPDVMPSDITGFNLYNKATGTFEYSPGAAMCNLFLADEINRTSSKTQSALLEVMEEGRGTVDGTTRSVPQPFTVIATQNPVGSAGTQMLPESQLDRFMIRLVMGYPDLESEIHILKERHTADPLDTVKQVATAQDLLQMQQLVSNIYVSDPIYRYIAVLSSSTRNHPLIHLGVSPRGSLALSKMAKACAFLLGRDYVIPEDVQKVVYDVWEHRILLKSQARIEHASPRKVLEQFISDTEIPK